MDSLLKVTDLRVTYGRAVAVKRVDLDIGEGQAIGLIGPNGAGKSSTLLAIMGAVKSQGTVTFKGQSLHKLQPESVARLGIAIVPEGRHLFPSMSVQENLMLGRLARRTGKELRIDDSWVADLFPITQQYRNRPAGLLSGGQQQQVAIARVLLSDPDLLLLDEPSLGLSPTAVNTVFDALERIKALGIAVLLVEQRAQRAMQFCERSYVLSEGEIRLEVESKTKEDISAVVAAYFGRSA
jgi:ABC-type branched-chain amino acid transport systems, ATPase component